MSIGPVKTSTFQEAQTPDTRREDSQHLSGTASESAKAVEVHFSTPQHEPSQSRADSTIGTSQQDEIQVERDSQDSNQIVVRYINQTNGTLVFQVPSDQVLNVARAIHDEIQHETETREDLNVAWRGKGQGH